MIKLINNLSQTKTVNKFKTRIAQIYTNYDLKKKFHEFESDLSDSIGVIYRHEFVRIRVIRVKNE
ncbi:hypothetical protein [Flavobacterium sp.]|uniref:hypothetical protein n=1 Tax=Flavobacterium sp. TaxID=239 RepID=UPI0026234C85|nr:hypothetical protein [Flavobacterium sp.]